MDVFVVGRKRLPCGRSRKVYVFDCGQYRSFPVFAVYLLQRSENRCLNRISVKGVLHTVRRFEHLYSPRAEVTTIQYNTISLDLRLEGQVVSERRGGSNSCRRVDWLTNGRFGWMGTPAGAGWGCGSNSVGWREGGGEAEEREKYTEWSWRHLVENGFFPARCLGAGANSRRYGQQLVSSDQMKICIHQNTR